MKIRFGISTLLWCSLVAAVIMGSYAFVIRERAANEASIAAVQAESALKISAITERLEATQKRAIDEGARTYFLKEKLGYFANKPDPSKPAVKLVRMPEPLGGMQLHGLPFTWQWRFYLPNPDEFELCWAISDIPQAPDSFDVPEDKIHRSHLNLGKQNGYAGTLLMGNSGGKKHDGKSPLDVLVYFRIDADKNGGQVFLNYEMTPAETNKNFRGRIYHGIPKKLNSDEVSWMQRPGVSKTRGGPTISGFGIENSSMKIPIHFGPMSLDEPTLLLKVRATKEVGEFKFEPFDGPSPGLLIWVQKRSTE